jgi:hypothetical protein
VRCLLPGVGEDPCVTPRSTERPQRLSRGPPSLSSAARARPAVQHVAMGNFSLAIDQWTEQSVQELVTYQATESLSVEFKRDMPHATPSDRREIAKDISAMANSAGGWIVYGVDEKSVGPQNTKVAAALTPLAGPPDAAHWVDDVVAGLVTPRPRFRVREIPSSTTGVFVVAQVLPSGDDLHMVHERYYRRTEQGARPMNEPEVRQAYEGIARRRAEGAAYTRGIVERELEDAPFPGFYVAIIPQTFGDVVATAALDIRTPAFQILGTDFARNLGPHAVGCEALIKNYYRFRVRRDGTVSTVIRGFRDQNWFPDEVLISLLEVTSVARALWRQFSIHQPATGVLRAPSH